MLRYFLSLMLISADSGAKTAIVIKGASDKDNIKSAKIVFVGDVSSDKVAEMMADINDIKINYPTVKEIALWVNSFGGDRETGYMGAESVRGSWKPIKRSMLA